MCLTVLDEASVLIMTYANVIRSGLVKTVPSSLVDLSTIALVRVLSCHFRHLPFFCKPFPNFDVKLGVRLIGGFISTRKTFPRSWTLRSFLQM